MTMTRHEKCVQYECSQDLYTLVRAELMTRIYKEEAQTTPDQLKIDTLMQEQMALYQEQRNLDAHDEAAVAHAIATCNAKLKALRQEAL